MDTSNTKFYKLPVDAVWLITGCSSGLGKSLALLVNGQPTQRLVATARQLNSLSSIPEGPNVLKVTLDVTSSSSINAAVAAALGKFGRIDVLVNNAGYSVMGDTESTTEEQARRVVETDFWGTSKLTIHAMRVMREENPKTGQQGGVVMNVTSAGGFIGFPGSAYYNASKFAVEGFTESVSREVRPEWNTHFCLIEPGGIATNFAGASLVRAAPHPSYLAPDTPARLLEEYILNIDNQKTWSSPQSVATAMYEVVSRGQRIPIRVPFGPDAWGLIKDEIKQVDKELDELRYLSESVGHAKQFDSIQFIRKDK